MFGQLIRTKIFEFFAANNYSMVPINTQQGQSLSFSNFKLKYAEKFKGQLIKVSAVKGEDNVMLVIFNSLTKGPVIVHCEEKFAPPVKPGKS